MPHRDSPSTPFDMTDENQQDDETYDNEDDCEQDHHKVYGLLRKATMGIKKAYIKQLDGVQNEKKYLDVTSDIRKEPLVLNESPMFIGLIYSQNKKVKRYLQDQAILYGIDVLDA